MKTQSEQELSPILQIIRKQIRIFISVWSLGLIISFVALHTVDGKYEATLHLAPGPSLGAPSLGAKVNGVAAMGLLSNLGFGADDGLSLYDRYELSLTSHGLSKILMADERLLKGIFPQYWDSEKNTWGRPTGPVQMLKRTIKRLLRFPLHDQPNTDLVQAIIRDGVKVQADFTTDTLVLTFRHKDPEFALYLIQKLHTSADSMLRDIDRSQVASRILYLEEKLTTTQLNENKQILTEMLLQEQRNLMLIAVEEDYSVDLLDGPTVSSSPITPQAPIFLLVGLVLSTILAIAGTIAVEFVVATGRFSGPAVAAKASAE